MEARARTNMLRVVTAIRGLDLFIVFGWLTILDIEEAAERRALHTIRPDYCYTLMFLFFLSFGEVRINRQVLNLIMVLILKNLILFMSIHVQI